jgi:hypothetical protein
MRREQGASDSPTFWAISTLLARAFSTSACNIFRSNGSMLGRRFGRFAGLRVETAVFLRIDAPDRHKIANNLP